MISLTFSAHRPTYLPPAAARGPFPLFFFPAVADTGTPPLGAPSPSFLHFPFLCSARLRRRSSGRARRLPSPPFPPLSRALWQLIPAPSLLPHFPCRFLAPPPVMPAGHLWQAVGRRALPLPLPFPLYLYLSLGLISRPPLFTRITPTHA
jgi:hypothetical protein